MSNRVNGLADTKELKSLLPITFELAWTISEQTGLRISDVLRLKRKDVFKGEWTTIETKTKKKKKCKIDQEAIKMAHTVDKLLHAKRRRFLFWNKKVCKPYTRQIAWYHIAKAADSLNLRRIAPHSARKSYAQNLIREGMTIKQVQRRLNHASPNTTDVYIKNIKA